MPQSLAVTLGLATALLSGMALVPVPSRANSGLTSNPRFLVPGEMLRSATTEPITIFLAVACPLVRLPVLVNYVQHQKD
jgi:hypothetical protein